LAAAFFFAAGLRALGFAAAIASSRGVGGTARRRT
jgi:hypothetical protein